MGSQKIFDPFIVWVQKYFFPINVELNKICWLIRIFGSKKEWAKNNSGKNFLIKKSVHTILYFKFWQKKMSEISVVNEVGQMSQEQIFPGHMLLVQISI